MAEMEYHEVTAIFPLMTGQEFDELVKDIKENGLHEAIWTYQGKIIDGRNRDRACKKANIKPTYREWDGKGSLTHFIISLNLHRRHLTSAQRAVVAQNSLPFFEAERKEKQKASLPKKGDKGFQCDGNNSTTLDTKGTAREDAAKLVNVNPRYIQDVKKIKEETPNILPLLEDGTLTVPKAKILSKMEPDRQKEIVKDLKSDKTDKEKKTIVKDIKEKEPKKQEETFGNIMEGHPKTKDEEAMFNLDNDTGEILRMIKENRKYFKNLNKDDRKTIITRIKEIQKSLSEILSELEE